MEVKNKINKEVSRRASFCNRRQGGVLLVWAEALSAPSVFLHLCSPSTPPSLPFTLAALLINVGWGWPRNRSSFQCCHTGEMERQTVAKVDLTTNTHPHTHTHTHTLLTKQSGWTQHAIKGFVSAQRVCQPASSTVCLCVCVCVCVCVCDDSVKCVHCMFAQLSVFVWIHTHFCFLPTHAPGHLYVN